MWRGYRRIGGYLALLLAANLSLLLPEGEGFRSLGALLLIGLLPGFFWARCFFNQVLPPANGLIAAGLSYSFTCLGALLLHYLPGPIYLWHLVAVLNILAVLPVLISGPGARHPNALETRSQTEFGDERRGESGNELKPPLTAPLPLRSLAPLLLILLISLSLRLANLGYSEFQGDEALAMLSAAEALEGHEDALFLRSKGPAEVLLPMALWRLTGVINEYIARLPFTLAALLAVLTIYAIGRQLHNQTVGWLAAGFFGLNGFMVAFGRIVQYQVLVIWFSALAFLFMLYYSATRQRRYALLGGVWLGVGLLAHYDAILVLPALGWLLIPTEFSRTSLKSGLRSLAGPIKAGLVFIAAFLSLSLPFYLPYLLDPQANRTGAYVGQRIGNELRNNLPDFFHFNTFYSSSYYIMITGLLVLGLLAGQLWQARRRYQPAVLPLVGLIVAIIFKPDLININPIDLTILPFALLFGAAFLVSPLVGGEPALLLWLAVPFLGYNFIVALGLTHIYTTVPAWSLLAAMGWYRLVHLPLRRLASSRLAWLARAGLGVGLVLAVIFLWNAFVRHDVEYWQDYPAGKLWFYWDPYEMPPEAGFFGFAHRAGWKAIGQKISTGELSGDYSSNEEPDVTTWYTRGAPRACDPQPEFYFLADDLIDPVELPMDVIAASYKEAGKVVLPNQKQMRIMQQLPASLDLGQLDEAGLARAFDQSARPAAFARSARGSQPVQANFGNLVQLIGYDLDTRRAWPGGRIPVTLYWQPLAPIPLSYQIFTHLESGSGPVAQADGVPVCWSYPTDLWRPGQIIADQHAILISPDTPPGRYSLEVGLYLAGNFERLDIIDIAGNPAGVSLTLTEVDVNAEP
jgi:4-amino-4-deoxy-L-arabinose transferase-like glycosyltransferase